MKNSTLKNGIITYDIAFEQGLAFVGAVARAQDHANFERFYMRLHLSGKPDAVQYTPYFNAMTGWQLYPKTKARAQFKYNAWNQVKVVLAGPKAEMYINDMETPVLVVNELKRSPQSGQVGIYMETIPFMELTPVHISNFSYEAMDNPPLKGKYTAPQTSPVGTVPSWQVSNVFDERNLEGKTVLGAEDKQKLQWTPLPAEASGLTNLARLQAAETLLETGVKVGKNTVFARIKIHSDKAQVNKLNLGFSDKVRVFFNDRLLFSANDEFHSRDHRFLGTLGYYDALYLPLQKGDNDLWLAISEAMPDDGWGVQAKFENMDGIRLE